MGAAPCAEGCGVASLIYHHQVQWPHLPLTVMTPNISSHCQVFLGGQNHPWWRTVALDGPHKDLGYMIKIEPTKEQEE